MKQEATLSPDSAMDTELVRFTINSDIQSTMFSATGFLFHSEGNAEVIFKVPLVLHVQALEILMQGNLSNLVSVVFFFSFKKFNLIGMMNNSSLKCGMFFNNCSVCSQVTDKERTLELDMETEIPMGVHFKRISFKHVF